MAPGHEPSSPSNTLVRRRLDPGEVADHEVEVHEPEGEPDRPDDKKRNRKEDQARSKEQQGVTEQPEAIAFREYRARPESSIRPTEAQ